MSNSSQKEVDKLLESAISFRWPILNLSHRNLTVLPDSLKKLGKVKTLLLNDNRIIMPPMELVALKNSQVPWYCHMTFAKAAWWSHFPYHTDCKTWYIDAWNNTCKGKLRKDYSPKWWMPNRKTQERNLYYCYNPHYSFISCKIAYI